MNPVLAIIGGAVLGLFALFVVVAILSVGLGLLAMTKDNPK